MPFSKWKPKPGNRRSWREKFIATNERFRFSAWLRFMRNLTKQCHQTKKMHPTHKKKTDKKGGHGTFLYIFALTVISNWAPKITLQRFTVIRQKILNWPFAAFKKGVFGEKKVNRWNDRYKILGRDLKESRNILIFEWSPIFCQWRFNRRSPIAIHPTYTV